MAFVYEKVREEDRGLFESLGFKDFFEKRPKSLMVGHTKWCIDRERRMYLVGIGSFIDCPYCYDLSYKGRIVRVEKVDSRRDGNSVWKITKIKIPRSVYEDKEAIVSAIEEAFSMYRGLSSVAGWMLLIDCEPEMVEEDYNGR